MAKKSQRQQLIDSILNKNGDNDNPQELAFLESLSLAELSRLANDDDDEENEFTFEGEVTEYDFDDDEL
jgi:hypothetical protein